MDTSLTTFFTTLAQVSFTISGLMAVAIAGDNERREYWFGHQARSFFVYICFLLLLLPGFVSIGGLIPPFQDNIPSWPLAAFVLGLIYIALSVSFFFKKKKLTEPDEFKRLEKNFSKVNSEMSFYGIFMIILGVFGFSSHYINSVKIYGQQEPLLGILLFFSMFSGAINSVDLLRTNETSNNEKKEISPIPSSEQPETLNQKGNQEPVVLIALLTALIAFLIGLIFRQKDD